MAKVLKLKNYFFLNLPNPDPLKARVSLQDFLNQELVTGKQSRYKMRFMALIRDRLVEIDRERKALLEECAEKKDDKPVYFDKDDKETTDAGVGVRYKIADVEKFDKEYNEYLAEDLVIAVTPDNRNTIYGVRDILLNTNQKLGGVMDLVYDEYCQAFENIGEEEIKEEKPVEEAVEEVEDDSKDIPTEA